MDTLITFHQPLNITNFGSFNQRTQLSFYHKTLKTYVFPSSTSWKLSAQGKGFGSKNIIKQGKTKNDDNKVSTSDRGNKEDDDEDDKIPEVIFERMIKRIVGYVGVPLLIGFSLLKLFDILKGNHLWDVPIWVPFVTTFVTFGSSVLGVAYGSLSTSWDPDSKGSFLGLEEAKQNWDEMWKEENN